MVGAVALRPVLAEETALSLYQKSFFLDRHPSPVQKVTLIPETIDSRQLPADHESWGYDRSGRMGRVILKGLFVDSYH